MRANVLAIVVALVSLPALAVERVQYSAVAYSTGTNTAITTVKPGQSFDLAIIVQDLRPNGTWTNSAGQVKPLVRGVFAAYCELPYDRSRLIYYKPKFGPFWPNGQIGIGAPDKFEVGAIYGSFSGSTVKNEVCRIPVYAKSPATLTIIPDVASIPHPEYSTQVFGNIGASPPEPSYVSPDEIKLVGVTIAIKF